MLPYLKDVAKEALKQSVVAAASEAAKKVALDLIEWWRARRAPEPTPPPPTPPEPCQRPARKKKVAKKPASRGKKKRG